jgi:alpha-ketoglutarate-dependent taurine dioxygenase
MAFSISNLKPRFGAVVTTDKATLLSGKHAAELRALLEERRVVVMRGIGFDNDEQIAFGATLGRMNLGEVREDGLMTISLNEKENVYAKYHIGTFEWHQDGTYDNLMPVGMILTPRGLAEKGGETEIADTTLAYEDLPASERKALDDMKIIHTMEASYRDIYPNPTDEQVRDWRGFEPRTFPAVCRHRNGRKSLVIGWSATEVVGMTLQESKAFLDRMNAWATQPQYVYQHTWQMGDVLLWDNHGAMHRAVPYAATSKRSMRRVTFLGDDMLVPAA